MYCHENWHLSVYMQKYTVINKVTLINTARAEMQ